MSHETWQAPEVREMHLWPEGIVQAGGVVTAAATIEMSGVESRRLWYRVPAEFGPLLSENCDPFVVATCLTAMEERGRPLRVHGTVSPSLLDNLASLQEVWVTWEPERYGRTEIVADSERESTPADSNAAVCAFTGGVDSSYTIHRHHKGLCGRLNQKIEAGLFVHGMDIPLEDVDAFERASDRARETLSSIGLPLIPMATNHKDLNPDWDRRHGVGLASCLMLLAHRFRYGLIASTYSYRDVGMAWGSNPLTDPLLSSDSFRIVHDAAGRGRSQKLHAVASWPEAFRNLRVCWLAPRKDENCGRCSKCVTTLLGFQLWRLPLPPSFPKRPLEEAVLELRNLGEQDRMVFSQILEMVRPYDDSSPWVRALERCVRFNERRAALRVPSRQPALDGLRRARLRRHERRGP